MLGAFMKFYLKLLFRQSKLLTINIFCLIIDVALEMAQPFLLATILDDGVKKQNFDLVLIISLIMMGIAVLAIVFSVISMRCSVIISNRFCYDLREKLFHKIQGLSSSGIDKYEVPTLITRMTSDINVIRRMMTLFTRAGLKVPLMIIFGSVFMFIYNVKLALIVLGICVFLFFAVIIFIVIAHPKFKKAQIALDNINRVVEEDIDGIQVVKSFVREDYKSEQFKKINDDFIVLNEHAYRISNLNTPLILLAANIATALILGLGGFEAVSNEKFTTGRLASFINFSTIVLMTFNMISGLAVNISRSYACFERINEVLNEKDDNENSGKIKEIVDGSVVFHNVTFSYARKKDKVVVGPIDLTVNSGEIIGIVGGTGAGKSSLISLIPRLYDTLEGSVLVGGKDVKDYNIASLRESIGLVDQKSILFSGTIRENICFGKALATDEEINEVLKAADAYDFVYSFNKGLDTILAKGGSNLSGGQRQRLCIARALLKKPKILILDDSMSAIDSATEERIKEYIYKLKDITIFIISQKISSVSGSSKIVVMNEGKIESVGRHEELLVSSPVYLDMYETQKKEVS